ncbi:GYD domain-containing protein [Candidatus Bipolaricaulota bacterium]|nr:GYD domain-containing protein [Candidatus Bipolaricaulota bacterium]
MATYVLLSRVTDSGAATVKKHPERIKEVNHEIEAFGARVIHQDATVGAYDFVTIVEAPDLASILRVSVERGSRGSVKIQTLPAVPIDDFIESLSDWCVEASFIRQMS